MSEIQRVCYIRTEFWLPWLDQKKSALHYLLPLVRENLGRRKLTVTAAALLNLVFLHCSPYHRRTSSTSSAEPLTLYSCTWWHAHQMASRNPPCLLSWSPALQSCRQYEQKLCMAC